MSSDRALRVRAGVVDRMTEHARRGWPNEVVGVLAADSTGLVVAAVELGEGGADAVRLPRGAVESAARELERDGLTPIGSYHSHGTRGPYPTEADRLAMRAGEAMLIVCARTLEVRAFELSEDRLHAVELDLAVEPGTAL